MFEDSAHQFVAGCPQLFNAMDLQQTARTKRFWFFGVFVLHRYTYIHIFIHTHTRSDCRRTPSLNIPDQVSFK